jgi:hypothetical protein
MYLALPGLRGFWPGSSVDENNYLQDLSCQNAPSGIPWYLIPNAAGTPRITSYKLVPEIELGGLGSNDCYYRQDHAHWDILGTESWIVSSKRGLTCGAWVYPTGLGTDSRYVISKWAMSSAGDSYLLYYNFSNDNFTFYIRDSLAVADSVDFTSSSSTGQWHFVVGQFAPNAGNLNIWVNGTLVSSATALTNIQNTTSNFVIGAAHSLADREWAGYISFPFLTATALDEQWIFTLYQQTRPLFGV